MNKYLSVVYDENVKPLTAYPAVFARYLKARLNMAEGATLLDAGCGRAEMINAFSDLGLLCCGCDREAPPDGSTTSEINEVDFSTGTMPYQNGEFDYILSKSVIEHILDPQPYLSELYRLLKPGGQLILLTPDWESQMKVFYEDHTHVHPFTPLGLSRLLAITGFTSVSVERFSHHPAIWSNRPARWGAWLLRRCLSTPSARWCTKKTGINYFRWAVELQVFALAGKK